MKIILSPNELEAALLKHYPALDGHAVTQVEVIRNNHNRLEAVEIFMTPNDDTPNDDARPAIAYRNPVG